MAGKDIRITQEFCPLQISWKLLKILNQKNSLYFKSGRILRNKATRWPNLHLKKTFTSLNYFRFISVCDTYGMGFIYRFFCFCFALTSSFKCYCHSHNLHVVASRDGLFHDHCSIISFFFLAEINALLKIRNFSNFMSDLYALFQCPSVRPSVSTVSS